jgi:hypothetical protein
MLSVGAELDPSSAWANYERGHDKSAAASLLGEDEETRGGRARLD